MSTASIQYDDGIRVVQLIPAAQARRPGDFNTLRLGLERWLGHPIDWSSLPAPIVPLLPDETLVTWNVRAFLYYLRCDNIA